MAGDGDGPRAATAGRTAVVAREAGPASGMVDNTNR